MSAQRLLLSAQSITLYAIIAFSIGACQKQSLNTTPIGTGPTPIGTNPGGCCTAALIHWAQTKDLPTLGSVTIGREMAQGFTINSKGYITSGWLDGSDNSFLRAIDTWEFDPSTGAWTQKADYPSWSNYGGANFVIGDNAYVVAQGDQATWQYSQTNNKWTQKADFPKWRQYATGFSVGGVGYVGGGDNGSGPGVNHFGNDWYMYIPAFDSWTRIANFPGRKRQRALSFVNGTNGYVCLGDSSDFSTNDYFHDLWQYNAQTNVWTKKAEFPGKGRCFSVGLSANGVGIVTTGVYGNLGFTSTSTSVKDTWEYKPGADTWTQLPDFGGGVRNCAVGFAIGSNVYVGGGNSSSVGAVGNGKKDLWIMAL